MPASLFGERFLSYREPAWHRLGLVLDEPITALKAFRRMGPYEVKLVPLSASNGVDVEIPHKAIVRSPTNDDPQNRMFGIVSEDYVLIQPKEFCEIWDEHVAEPIETIGALQQGETLFISTKLPSFDVKGDQVDNYLVAASPMTGGDAAEARVTPVRPVCQNTLILSAHMATETYRIVHVEGAKERLASWLSEIHDRALERTEAIKEAFDILAAKQVSTYLEKKVLEKTYPLPSPPRLNAPAEVLTARQDMFEYICTGQKARRSAARELFHGRGQGSDVPAAEGTAWGLYNAVVELEDYRRGRGVESISRNAMYGSRATIKAQAFEACLEISQN